jgi:hypothetical protein
MISCLWLDRSPCGVVVKVWGPPLAMLAPYLFRILTPSWTFVQASTRHCLLPPRDWPPCSGWLFLPVTVLSHFLVGLHLWWGLKPWFVAWSHELTKNKRRREMNKNTMNTRNATRYNSGLLPTARTTIPIESLQRKTRGWIPEIKIGIGSVESHEWETGGRITSVRD